MSERTNGSTNGSCGQTLTNYFENHFRPDCLGDSSQANMYRYQTAIRRLKEFNDYDARIDKVTDMMLARFSWAYQRQGAKPQTAKYYVRSIRSIVRHALPHKFPKGSTRLRSLDYTPRRRSLRRHFEDKYRPECLTDYSREQLAPYRASVHKLCRFCERDVTIFETTPKLLQAYQEWMIEGGLKSRSVRLYCLHITDIRRHANPDKFDKVCGEWPSRKPRVKVTPFVDPKPPADYEPYVEAWLNSDGSRYLSISDLADLYRRFAAVYYRKHGRPTNEQEGIHAVMKPLLKMFGRIGVADFGPRKLKAVRKKLIDAGHCRNYINQNVNRIRRMFRWGVEEELVPPAVYQSLAAVANLKRGRSKARETEPVDTVSNVLVDVTLSHLSETVSDMVRFQRLTGCRPEEVCKIRPCDVDRNDAVWRYTPPSHKTEHHGRARVILIGPKAQAVLLSYILREPGECCFQTGFGGGYTTHSYRRAISRAADRAGVDQWAPNRLRHSAATEIRQRFGLEAARVTLGHSKADTTQIYAERDENLAAEVMDAIG